MPTRADAFDKYKRYQMIALAFRPSASRPEHRALKEAALSPDIETAMPTTSMPGSGMPGQLARCATV